MSDDKSSFWGNLIWFAVGLIAVGYGVNYLLDAFIINIIPNLWNISSKNIVLGLKIIVILILSSIKGALGLGYLASVVISYFVQF